MDYPCFFGDERNAIRGKPVGICIYIYLPIERINWIIGESVSRSTKHRNAVRFVPTWSKPRKKRFSPLTHNRIAISMQVDVSRTKRGARISAKSVSVARSGKDDLRTRTLNSPHIGGSAGNFRDRILPLRTQNTHVRSRWKNLFGSNGAAGNVWGNNEGKRVLRLS